MPFELCQTFQLTFFQFLNPNVSSFFQQEVESFIYNFACSDSVCYGQPPKKVKSPYFTSVARNSHLTNKVTEADGALTTPSPSCQCSVLRVSKAT